MERTGTILAAFVFVLLICCVNLSHAGAVLEALWEFENNFTASNDSAYNGTPYGSISFVPGKIGQAVSFKGGWGEGDHGLMDTGDLVDHFDSQKATPASDFNSGLSVMCWINPSETPSGGTFLSHDKTWWGYDYFGFGISVADGRVGFGVKSVSGNLSGQSDSSLVPSGQWTHITVTWNGSATDGIQIYINGNQVDTHIACSGFSGLNSTGNLPFRIGADHTNSAGSMAGFAGSLDHLSIWKGVLTAEQIQNDFENVNSSLIKIQSWPVARTSDVETFFIDNSLYLAAVFEFSPYDSSSQASSKLYKWELGNFIEVQSITTYAAEDCEHFIINDTHYLAIANYHETSRIYKWNGASFEYYQEILPTWGIQGLEFFTINGEHYLSAVVYYDGNHYTTSIIYKWTWDDTKSKYIFSQHQTIPTEGPIDSRFFRIGEDYFLGILNYVVSGPDNFERNSKIYKWDTNSNQFIQYQSILTSGGFDLEAFEVNNDSYIAIANTRSHISGINSKVYKWNGNIFDINGATDIIDTLSPSSIFNDFELFEENGKLYMAASVNHNYGVTPLDQINSVIFEWDEYAKKFNESIRVETYMSKDWETFRLNGQLYLVNASYSPNPDLARITVYKWSANKAPISDAGPDQSITEIGEIVQLDGTQSYDLEGDPITYNWTLVSKPEGSNAALSDSMSPTPTFQADLHGDYIVELVVSDASSSSEPDSVVVTFENVIPVANAGTNKSVVQGETVCFDGSDSFDANLDPLAYSWSIVSTPAGSSAFLDDPAAISPCLTTDLPGNYEVSLIVNDGFVDSEPSTVTVLAISYLDATTCTLQETITAVNTIDLGDFKNKNMQNTLTNKVNATLELVDQGSYAEALDKLQNDLLGKTNGCTNLGEPDKNDWIQECACQDQVYPLIIEAIGYLESL